MDLEDMFGRRPRPLLQLHVQLLQRPPEDPHEELHIYLANEGRAPARFTRMLGRVLDPSTVIAGGSGIADVSAINDGSPRFLYIDNVGVILPNGMASAVGHAIIRRDTKGSPLKLHAKWYCDEMQARSAELDLVSGVLHVAQWDRSREAAPSRRSLLGRFCVSCGARNSECKSPVCLQRRKAIRTVSSCSSTGTGPAS